MKKKRLSVAIATYNEENNIARCLKSAKGWVDEIAGIKVIATDNIRDLGIFKEVKVLNPFAKKGKK